MDSTQSNGIDDLRVIDRFPLIAKIGEGGFGVVYLAYDPRLGNEVTARVAIKVLLSKRLEHRQRFIQEAQLMRQLGSGIVEVHESGEYSDQASGMVLPYFVMEYCERGTLAERLARLGRGLTLDESVGLIEAIAASARTLAIPRTGHPNGIVHRDLKPSNFLIRRVEDRDSKAVGALLMGDEQLILGDFSIAKSHDPDATALTMAGGTPGYGAPEQFFRKDTGGNALPPRSDVDPTVDVFAASVVVLSAISNTYRIDAARYSKQDFAATGPFEKQLKRAMSSNPRDRHAGFDEWRDALLAAHRRFCWRRQGLKAAAVALLVVVVLAAAWSLTATGDQQDSADPVGPTAAVTGAEDSTSETEDQGEVADPVETTSDEFGAPSTTDQTVDPTTTTSDQPTTASQGEAGSQISGLGGLCIDVPNQTFRDGQNLWMWDCNGTIAQDWTIADDRVTVMGYCLDIEGPVSDTGAALQIWECQDVPQQRWQTTTEGEIKSTWNGLCVAVAFADPNRGAALQMESCDGSDAQRWRVF